MYINNFWHYNKSLKVYPLRICFKFDKNLISETRFNFRKKKWKTDHIINIKYTIKIFQSSMKKKLRKKYELQCTNIFFKCIFLICNTCLIILIASSVKQKIFQNIYYTFYVRINVKICFRFMIFFILLTFKKCNKIK